MGLIVKQLKTNLFDSVRCVKFNCSSFLVASTEFFEKYGPTSFMRKPTAIQNNSKVVVCLPDVSGPDGFKCRMIPAKDIPIYNQAYTDMQAEKAAEAAASTPDASNTKNDEKTDEE